MLINESRPPRSLGLGIAISCFVVLALAFALGVATCGVFCIRTMCKLPLPDSGTFAMGDELAFVHFGLRDDDAPIAALAHEVAMRARFAGAVLLARPLVSLYVSLRVSLRPAPLPHRPREAATPPCRIGATT